MKEIYQFGSFRLDVNERLLRCSEEIIPLTPKQFELLFYFVGNAGNLATKSDLLDSVWADSYVEETTLARNVSWLRKKLSSHSNGEQFIETVPKLGYRFTAEVTQKEGDEFIIEEQTVQHFITEETIQIDDEDFTKREDEEDEKLVKQENKIFTLPSAALNPTSIVSESSTRSFAFSSLFLVAIGIVALALTAFAVYHRNEETAKQNIGLDVNTKITIENITVDANRENVDTGIKVQSGDLIYLSVVGEYKQETDRIWTFEGDKNAEGSSSEYIFEKAAPRSLIGWVGSKTDHNDYFQVSENNSVMAKKSGILYFALNNLKNNADKKSGEFIVTVTLNRPNVIGEALIKIGSTVNLQNRYPNAGGFLDAWGQVWSKPEFSIVPTETKFVSTHKNPNRDNGSGSWEIVSATGKSNGETLMVGDKVHLKNRYPNGGYLDSCGWVKDMPVFKDFTDQTTAVFTTKSNNRDNGTGTWIIRSTDKPDGSDVLEGDSIALENSFSLEENGIIRKVGFLNVGDSINSIPAFDDYDGSHLIFTRDISTGEPIPDIWTITISKASLK